MTIPEDGSRSEAWWQLGIGIGVEEFGWHTGSSQLMHAHDS
jgi:hypothetical protein